MGALCPCRSFIGGAVLECWKFFVARRVGDVLQVEEASGPIPRGFMAIGVGVDATRAEEESDGSASWQFGSLADLLFLDSVREALELPGGGLRRERHGC